MSSLSLKVSLLTAASEELIWLLKEMSGLRIKVRSYLPFLGTPHVKQEVWLVNRRLCSPPSPCFIPLIV